MYFRLYNDAPLFITRRRPNGTDSLLAIGDSQCLTCQVNLAEQGAQTNAPT